MKLSQLKKKYPKAFAKFEKGYDYSGTFDYNVREWWSDIVDFMDRQGIKGEVSYNRMDVEFLATIYYGCDMFTFDFYKSRRASETQLIDKLFQILEERSKE